MAITAKFQADFSSFIDAVNKAEVELKDIGDAAFSVQTKLTKMVDNFSGRKLIQEATVMAEAIEQAGGATKLTAKELANVSAKAQEAAEKMKALGYDVPPGIQKLADATRNVGVEAKQTQSLLGGLAGQLAGMFSIAAVVAFGREVIQAGDSIQKMADQTGISTEEVQKLQYIAGQSGSSIESLVGAVQNLQVRLGDDDSGAAGAMKKLGINLEDFSKLNTYQQLLQLGAAIKDVHDPTEQASDAAALFGKTWKEILPAIKSGMQEVGDQAPIMADATVKALDRIGDTLTAAKQQAIGWGGSVVLAIEGAGYALGQFASRFNPDKLFTATFGMSSDQILRMEAALNDPDGLLAALGAIPKPTAAASDSLKSLRQSVEGAGLSAKDARSLQDGLTDTVKASIIVNEKAAEAAKKLAEGQEKFRASVEGLSFKKFVNEGLPMVGLIQDLSDRSGKFREHMDDLASSVNEYHDGITVAGDEMATVTIPMFGKLLDVLPQNTKAIDKARDSVDGFGSTLHSALSGVDKILSGVNNAFAQTVVVAARAADQIGQVFSKGLSNLGKGDWISIIATGVAAVGSLFGKLFSNPEKQINPVRQAFVDAAGGLAELNKQAHDAGLTLDHLLDAKNPEQYQKAIEELNAAFEFQDTAMSKLNETVQKYGFSIEELGPALQRQNLDEQAQTLYQDFQLLTAAGIDHTAVLTRMADGVNAYVQNAQALGIEVPASLEPVLQQMADLGLLTDKSGNKIENLQDSGITFSQTMTQGFKSIVDAVEKLANAITGKLNPAIKNIPTDVTVGVHYNYDDFRSPDVIPMATGGMGRVTSPTLFLAGEKGPENFAFGDSVGGGNGATQSVLYDILAALRDQPRQIRDAVLLAG